MKKQSIIAGALLIGGALTISVNAQDELLYGILVAKDRQTAVVRNCATEELVTVQYGDNETHTYLLGETVGFQYNAAGNGGVLKAHFPEMNGNCFFHS